MTPHARVAPLDRGAEQEREGRSVIPDCAAQVFDGYFVKYFASVVALLVYGAPIYFRDPSKRGSQDDITQDYIRAMRLLQNTSR